jgi:chemotaxis protein histidine kinase CheA
LALLLYEFLLKADNCRVILLTGTPIINYPNEIGILFNILRGYIKTWSFILNAETNKKLSKDILQEIFNREKLLDYMDYLPSSKTLTITRNPYGFENKISSSSIYKGVTNYNERGQITDVQFIQRIVKLLKANDIIAVPNGTTYAVNTALPDTLDEFMNVFINKETGNISNVDKFKRRIIGLTSYFRSAQEELLPTYDRNFDRHEVKIFMSDYQFHIYENYRQEERKMEKPNKKTSEAINADGLFKEPSSTYRIFSRLACNFVMPSPPGRPTPSQYKITTKIGDGEEVEDNKMTIKIGVEDNKIQAVNKVEQKEQEKRQKEEAKRQKEEAKRQKEQEKEEAKRLKEEAKRQKEEEKRQKEQAKEEAKRLKEEAKRQKEEAKRLKEEEKERKKAEKLLRGGKDNEDEEDEKEEDEEDEKEEDEEDEKEKDEKERRVSERFSEFVDRNADEIIPLENYKDEDAILREVDELEGDELLENMGNVEYKEAIKASMQYLKLHSREYLTPEGLKTYSPKFLAMLDNINDPEHRGLHLVYSQFRSMEGIGIFCLTLEANGYAKFKIKRTGTDGWELNMSEEDMGKPCYALYTGTEDAEEREIIRNIYNGMWDYIPNNIATQLRTKSLNNNLGEIIKILMITSAGSEGINLRNTRYVHIMEPYWHPVRVEQVIGRARRICSHQSLPKELQTVEVFIYIMMFTQAQLDSDFAIELKLKDLSKNRPYLPQTSDQKLFEISTIKEQLTSQLLKAVKETSIDCATHSKASSKEGLACLSFGQPNVNSFSYNPNYTQDENDTVAALNIERIDWEARPITIKTTGKRYMLRVDTNQIYDYDSVIQARQIPGVKPILIGKFVKNARGEYEIVRERF